jgi:hypothetical protein
LRLILSIHGESVSLLYITVTSLSALEEDPVASAAPAGPH